MKFTWCVMKTNFILYCYILLIRLCGLMPWKLSTSIGNYCRESYHKSFLFHFSRRGSVYNILLIFTHLTLSMFSIRDLPGVYAVISVSKKVYFIHFTIITSEAILISIIWLLYVFRQKEIINLNNRLVNIDDILNSFIKHKTKKQFRANSIICVNLAVSLINCVTTLSLWPLSGFVLWSVPSTVNSWIFIQYSLFLFLLVYRFEKINKTILRIGHIPQKFEQKLYFISKWPARQLITSDIVNMKYAYCELCNACNQLVKFYAIPTLLILIYLVASFVFSLYFICLKYLILERNINPTELFSDTMCFYILIFPIICLVSTVNYVLREIKKTSDNIHWILSSCILTEQVENELIEFSHEVLRQKVEFSSYGAVLLDGSLLHSILGCLTYLVILIQFQIE